MQAVMRAVYASSIPLSQVLQAVEWMVHAWSIPSKSLRERKAAEERKERDYEESFRDSLGRGDRERKAREYMKRMTKGGKEMIDPTGRGFRIQPSSVTVIQPIIERLYKFAHQNRRMRHAGPEPFGFSKNGIEDHCRDQ